MTEDIIEEIKPEVIPIIVEKPKPKPIVEQPKTKLVKLKDLEMLYSKIKNITPLTTQAISLGNAQNLHNLSESILRDIEKLMK